MKPKTPFSAFHRDRVSKDPNNENDSHFLMDLLKADVRTQEDNRQQKLIDNYLDQLKSLPLNMPQGNKSDPKNIEKELLNF